MNLDLLYKIIKKNYHRLKDEKKALEIFQEQIKIYQLKKKKLKLGAVVFEFKKIIYGGITVHEGVDIRYIRQDNTDTDNLKIENRLKAIGWKWDKKNVTALAVVIFGFLCEIYTYVHYWYQKYLPTLAFRAEHFDYILKYGFEASFAPDVLQSLKQWTKANYWLIDVMTDFCIYFNIIF